MRKILACLLCFTILLSCACVGVSAEESYTFYKISIDAGSGAIDEKAIVKDGEIYIPATSLSNYTRFSFDAELKTFLIKGQDFKKAFKSVIIDIDKKRVSVSGKKFVDLSDCFEAEEELYLPLCQMLPILNADIYEVKDNTIYISNNKLSLAEVLYDFDVSDYYFNMSDEFYDNNSMAALTIVPSFIWDSIINWRYNRLDIVYNSGEYEDYKDAFSAFLSDDNLYLKAMAEDASAIDSTVEFFNKANDTAKDMKSVYGWVEAAGESEISSDTGGVLLDLLKAYYDSGDLKTDDLKGLNDAWTGGKISFGDCIEILTYVYTYATQVEDNRQMLNAVYNVDSKISKKETDRKAAKQVYDLYGDNVLPALYKEVAATVASDTIEDISPIGVYKATAKVAGTVLETFMPFKPGEVAKLPVYSDVVLSALSKYHTYDTTTDESTENLRLSLLLCMIASKKCFEVMEDFFEKDGVSYYEEQIESIEQLIMALYIVEENTDFDSFEHFDEYKKNNLKKIADSKLLDSLEEYQFTEELSSVNFDNTYWHINFGQTNGSNFIAQFHSDGTFSAFSQAGNLVLFEGEYEYQNNKLHIIFNTGYTGYQYDVILTQNESGFISIEQYQMQVGTAYYRIEPTDGKYYLDCYEKAQQEEKLKLVKKVFPDCYKSTETHKTNGSIKTGQYEGFWIGVDNGYSYITLRTDQTFSIRTNVDHTNHKIISPVSFEGEYVVYKRTVTYPDDSTGYSTALILYFEDYVLAWYEVEENYFGDQSSGYEYLGTEEARISYDKGVLLMNNDERAWCYTFNWGPDNDNETRCYLRFNEDNTYVGWQYIQLGLYSHETNRYEGQYSIEDGVLYLDENAYDLHAYTAGDSTMNLKAKGNYDIDFSGDYILQADEFYKYLVTNSKNQ